MSLMQALESVFDSLQAQVQKNLQSSKEGMLPDSSRPVSLGSSGSKTFDIPIDAGGNFSYSFEQYGGGVTVHATLVILDPNAVFSLTITDTDGGGGHWENLKAGQAVSFVLNTSFWHKTKIVVVGHSSIANTTGHGKLDYSY